MRANVLLLIVLSGTAVTLSGAARGAPPPAKADAATDKARELHLEGDELYKQGQYARARVSYLAAWALKKHWQLAGNLGDCELKLGMSRDAAEHLAYFLRTSPTQPPPAAAQKLYEQARSKTGALNISADTEGADVLVDGQLVGKAPLADPVFVEPGHHSVEARLGAKRATEEQDVALGGERAVVLKLVAPVTPPQPPPVVKPDKPVVKEPGRSLVPAFVIGGVGAVSLIGGAVLIGLAESKRSDAKALSAETHHSCVVMDPSPQGKCKDLASTAASADTFGPVGIAGFVVAGVAAAGVATYLLWPAPRRASAPARSVRAAPVVSSDGGGLTVVGAF